MSAQLKAQGLQAPDGLGLRAGKWEVPDGVTRKGVCVLLQGLGEFLEKYDEVAGELTARGFTVVSLDWRSQGASERGGRDNRMAHVAEFDEYDQDLAILMQKLAEPGDLPVIALAHSMGAHILLRYLSAHQRTIHCAALVAPMLDIVTPNYSPWLVRLLSLALNLFGASKRPLPGTAERDPLNIPFEENLVTSDPARYARMRETLKSKGFLRINGPTYGWLRAALHSIARVRSKSFADDVMTPLIVFGAGKDRIVETSAIREYVTWLPKADYVEFADAEHEILMERDEIRAEFWRAFDRFIEKELAESRSGFFAARGSNNL